MPSRQAGTRRFIIAVVVLLLILLILMITLGIDWINENAPAIQAFSTVLLVIVTWMYVRHTETLARQGAEQYEREAKAAVRMVREELKQARASISQPSGFGEYASASTVIWDHFCGTVAPRVSNQCMDVIREAYGLLKVHNQFVHLKGKAVGVKQLTSALDKAIKEISQEVEKLTPVT